MSVCAICLSLSPCLVLPAHAWFVVPSSGSGTRVLLQQSCRGRGQPELMGLKLCARLAVHGAPHEGAIGARQGFQNVLRSTKVRRRGAAHVGQRALPVAHDGIPPQARVEVAQEHATLQSDRQTGRQARQIPHEQAETTRTTTDLPTNPDSYAYHGVLQDTSLQSPRWRKRHAVPVEPG